MAKQSFSLEAGGPKRLVVTWSGIYRDVTVKLDDRTLGKIPNQGALSKGQDFRLPDGSRLHVQLVSTFMTAELRVLRNGEPLPGSPSDPRARLRNAYLLIYVVGGFNIVVGLAAALFHVQFLLNAGIGLASFLFGLIFLGLGYLVQKRLLQFALIMAIVLFMMDGLAALVFAAQRGADAPFTGLLVRIILLFPMVQGVPAIKALKARASAPPAHPTGSA